MIKQAAILFICTSCFGQSGIVTASRYAYDNWSHAGLPSTITYGTGGGACNGTTVNCTEIPANPWTPPTRVQSGSTVTCANTSADSGTINAAIAAAKPGSYVLIGNTTCDITSNITFANGTNNFSGVTLRGSGPQNTILNLSGSGTNIQFGVCCGGGFSGNLSAASYPAGTTSVTITSTSGTPVVGQIVSFNQCDNSFSGSPCTGTYSDPGTIWWCGVDYSVCAQDSVQSGSHNFELQYVRLTAVTNNGGGSFTVTFSPGLYMPDWSSNRTATLTGNNPNFFSTGAGVEDLTVNIGFQLNTFIGFSDTWASWIKGVRFIGNPLNSIIGDGTLQDLLANNYFFAQTPTSLATADTEPIVRSSASSALIINNIISGGNCVWGDGQIEGEVVAYNYCRDTSSLNDAISVGLLNHIPAQGMVLAEGNEAPHLHDDDTHGTNNLDTFFRNYVEGSQVPNAAPNVYGFSFDNFQRMDNVLGNAIGGPRITGAYQATGDGTSAGPVYVIAGGDALTSAGLMRWGNCDVISSPTCRFVSTEVPNSTQMPAATYPNATAFQNSTPANNNLPCSFFLSGQTGSGPCTPKLGGGTGLSWWKVCKTWTTFPTSCSASVTPIFPIAGPELTTGAYVSGFGSDPPSQQAYLYLPIDSSFQTSFSITASSWSNSSATCTIGGGAAAPAPCEILTVSGFSTIDNGTAEHIIGGFQLSGVNAACLPSGLPANNEIQMTGSSTTQVTYALASNPGVSCTGTLKFPDVRQFDERVYQNDPVGSNYTITVSSITGHGTVTSSDSVINCTTGTTGTCTDSTASGTVTLTETPASGYHFTGWGGGTCSGTATTCNVTTTATVTASFAYTITVSSIVGHGTVTSSDSVINCTTGTTGTCSDTTANGTITLTETPASGYTFNGWGGGTCSGTATTCSVTGTATVTATFVYTITVSSIVGNGTVTSSDGVINCTTGTTGTCLDSTAIGTVTLTETPSSGYLFSGWGGGTCSGTAPTCSVTTTATVTATFTINFTVFGTGSGSGNSVLGNPLYGVFLPQASTTKIIHPTFSTTRVLGPAGGNFYQCSTGDACFRLLNQAICDWVNDGVDDSWLIQVQHGTLVQTGVLHACTQGGGAVQSVTPRPKIISGHLPTGFFVVDSDTPLPEGVTVCAHATDDSGVRQPPTGDISTWWTGTNQGCADDIGSMWTLEGNWPQPGNFGQLIQASPWDATTNLGAANYIFRNAEFRPISTNTAQLTLVQAASPNVAVTQVSQFPSNWHFENIYFHSNGTDWCPHVGGITAYWYSAKGTGYANNDIGTVTTGNGDATYIINSSSGGVPIIASIVNQGSGYSIGANQATSATTGTGTGLAFNVLGTAAASPSCVTSFNQGGAATTKVVTAIKLADCTNCSVKFSYGAYFGFTGGSESHAIGIARSQGPDAVVHNWLEGQSEFITGGEAFNDPFYVVNDLEFRGNRVTNPPSLVGTYYTGPSLTIKNGVEFKACNRCLVDGNIVENIDESGVQNGECFNLNPRGCSGGLQCDNPQTTLQNITETNNICRHALTGFDMTGRSSYPPNGGGVGPALRNVNVSNNLVYDMGNSSYYDHFNNLAHPYPVRLSSTGESFICGGTRTGTVITLNCLHGPTGLSQTQIVPGDVFQVAGCDDSTWDLPGTINGFNSGPLALNGTVPNGLTVVYNNASAVASTSNNCVVSNSIGTPNNFNFIHNTMVVDTTINQAATAYIYDGVPNTMFSDLGCGGGPTNSKSITALTRTGGVVSATVSSLSGWPSNLSGNQIIVEVSGVTPTDLNGKFYYLGQSGGNLTWQQAGATESGTAFGSAAQMGTCPGVNVFAQYATFKNNLIAPNLLTTSSCPTTGTGYSGWIASGGTNAEGCKNGFSANGCSELTLDSVTSNATYADFPGRCPGQYTEMGGAHAGANPPVTLTFPTGTVCTGGPGSGNANCVGLANMMNGTFVGNDPNFLNYVLDPSSVYYQGNANAADDGKSMGANPFIIKQAIDNTWYQCTSPCGTNGQGLLPDAP